MKKMFLLAASLIAFAVISASVQVEKVGHGIAKNGGSHSGCLCEGGGTGVGHGRSADESGFG